MKVNVKWFLIAGIFLASLSTVKAFEEINDAIVGAIVTKAFDRCTGTFFVGQSDDGGTTNVDISNVILKAGPNDTAFTSVFSSSTEIKGDLSGTEFLESLDNANIWQISLLPNNCFECGKKICSDSVVGNNDCDTCSCKCDPAKYIAIHAFGDADLNNRIAVGDIAGKFLTVSEELSGVGTEGGTVLSMATGCEHVFASIFLGSNSPDSALNVIKVTDSSSGPTLGNPQVLQLSLTSPEAFEAFGGNANLDLFLTSDMHWDADLQTLYIGLQIEFEDKPFTGYGIVKGSFDANGNFGLSRITTSQPKADSINGLFAYRNFTFEKVRINIQKLRTMKTSTGLNYIIFSGNIWRFESDIEQQTEENFIWALPLGSKTSAQAGCIVKNECSNCIDCNCCPFLDTPLDTFGLVETEQGIPTPDGNGFEYTGDLCAETVGGCAAPWPAAPFQFADDIVVVGDTVYVTSLSNRNETDSNPGVWASTAMFDDCGKIVNWTTWHRVYTSVDGDGDGDNDKVSFLEVDAKAGKIWVVKQGDPDTVERTKWVTTGFAAGTLPYVVNQNLSNGVFSILDLTGKPTNSGTCQPTNGFEETTGYALFGGQEKVLFVHTNQTGNEVTLPDQFNTNENRLLTTNGLKGAGSILSLGYSCQGGTNGNYFFAGSQTGLFVYAKQNGGWFDTANNAFFELDADPFGNDDRWHKIDNVYTVIKGAVTAIVPFAALEHVYVLVHDTETNGGIVDKLYEIKLADNIANFTVRLVARSGAGAFPTNTLFSGFTIMNDLGESPGTEPFCLGNAAYGVISTNNGIWVSRKSLEDVKFNVSDDWFKVPRTGGIGFNFLRNASKDCDRSQKVWGMFFTDSEAGATCPGIFQNSRFIQLGIDPTREPGTEADNIIGDGGVTARPNCLCTPCPEEQEFWTARCDLGSDKRIGQSFHIWSDGARRFFTTLSTGDNSFSKLLSLPYGCDEFGMTVPFFDPALSTVSRIHCIENLGTGEIYAGTDTGVIVLR